MFYREQHANNYTIIDNGFLQDKSISLKARGLLATILSFPDNWSFCISGFSEILPEGRTAIENAVRELEDAGYIVRRPQGRGKDGRMLPAVWHIYERPLLDGVVVQDSPAVENQREEHLGSAVDKEGVKASSIPVSGYPYTVNKRN